MKTRLITGVLLTAAVIIGIVLYMNISGNKGKSGLPARLENDTTLTVPPSVFNLPVEIETKTLEAYLNGMIQGTFLRKNLLIEKGKSEKIGLSIAKNGRIRIGSNGRELTCSFPLRVTARLLDSRLGETISRKIKPVTTALTITLSTPVSIDDNWSIATKFRIRNISWHEDPVVKIGPFRKNLRPAIEEMLEKKKGSLAKMLDSELYKGANLQSTISDIWLDLQEPILISRDPAPLWIRFHCKDIHGRTVLNRNAITCQTSIHADLAMLTDTTSIPPPLQLPGLTRLRAEKAGSDSHINLYASTSFREINDQLEEHLQGRTLTREGYSIIITGIEAYGSSKGLSIKIDTGQDVKESLIASGNIVFYPKTQALAVRKFDYLLDTGKPIVSMGERILHDLVRDTVATQLNVGLDTLIGKVPGIITTAINRGKVGKTIDLRLDSLRIRKSDIVLDREKIHIVLYIQTKAALRLKRIKPGKVLKINA